MSVWAAAWVIEEQDQPALEKHRAPQGAGCVYPLGDVHCWKCQAHGRHRHALGLTTRLPAAAQEFKGKLHECGSDINQWPPEGREVLLRYLLHAADISNPLRPWPLSGAWSRRILEEFASQVQTGPAPPFHA